MENDATTVFLSHVLMPFTRTIVFVSEDISITAFTFTSKSALETVDDDVKIGKGTGAELNKDDDACGSETLSVLSAVRTSDDMLVSESLFLSQARAGKTAPKGDDALARVFNEKEFSAFGSRNCEKDPGNTADAAEKVEAIVPVGARGTNIGRACAAFLCLNSLSVVEGNTSLIGVVSEESPNNFLQNFFMFEVIFDDT